MDTVQNLKAFLAVARLGSFSAAARQVGLATSVIAKRVDQLEASIRTRLFVRSTRRMILTEAGQRWLVRAGAVVGDVDELMAEGTRSQRDLEGSLRVKAPTTLAVLHIGAMLARFQHGHPKVAMDVVLTDRALTGSSTCRYAGCGGICAPRRPTWRRGAYRGIRANCQGMTR